MSVALLYAHLSTGTYQDDDVDRFFLARQVWRDPGLLLDRWGMPVAVAVLAAPARVFGYGGVEVTTALVTALAVVLVSLAARTRDRRFPWLAGGFFFFQPLVMKLSFSGLAEPAAALILAAVLWSWYEGRRGRAVWLSGWLPLARIDAGVLTLVVLAAAWRKVSWRNRVGAVVPVVLWDLAGFALTGEPGYVFGLGGGRPLLSLGPLQYLHNEIIVAGPGVLFFFLWALAARGDFRESPGQGKGPKAPVGFPALAALLFLVHFTVLTLLAWEAVPFGRSIGFLRHLVASAPALALTAHWGARSWIKGGGDRRVLRIGLAMLWPVVAAVFLSHRLVADSFLGEGRVEWRWILTAGVSVVGLAFMWRPRLSRARAWAAVAALVVIVPAAATVRPIGLDPERQAIGTALAGLRNLGLDSAVVYTNHPWFAFLSGRDRYDLSRTPRLTRKSLEGAAPGSVVLWENHYGPRLWGDVPEGYLDRDPRYRLLLRLSAGRDRNFKVAVFQRVR